MFGLFVRFMHLLVLLFTIMNVLNSWRCPEVQGVPGWAIEPCGVLHGQVDISEAYTFAWDDSSSV